MNIPPTDLSPIIQGYGNKTVQIYRANLALWNARLVSYIATLPLKYPGTSVEMFDAHSLVSSVIPILVFLSLPLGNSRPPVNNQILATPAAYGFLNSTSSCRAYSTIINDPEIFLPQCGVPLKAYTWWDGYHVTWRVQEIVAQGAFSLPPLTPENDTRLTRCESISCGGAVGQDDVGEPAVPETQVRWGESVSVGRRLGAAAEGLEDEAEASAGRRCVVNYCGQLFFMIKSRTGSQKGLFGGERGGRKKPSTRRVERA